MAAEITWQKSLRRSTGEGPVIKKKTFVTANQSRKRLGSIQECDVFDENIGCKIRPLGNAARRKLSTQGSISDINQVEAKAAKKAGLLQSPSKIVKTSSFLKKLPARLQIPKEATINRDVPSPIPLPPGVFNIDYVDDSTTLYGRDIDSYVRTRELEYEVSENDIIKTDVKLVSRRKNLTEWLISVAHHFRCCQETIYYTIDLLDRTLAAKTYKPEFLQLVGVTSFLIASKLEEYYPADIEKLCQLTEDSYTPGEVVAMEVNILSLLNFKVFGREPMFFIRRYLNAAYSYETTEVRELAILLMDLQIPSIALWTLNTSRKAAVAVLGALLVMKFTASSTIEDIWTPNMVYYTGYKVDALRADCMDLLQRLVEIIGEIEYCIIEKYRSQSQHHGFLRNTKVINADKVRKVIELFL